MIKRFLFLALLLLSGAHAFAQPTAGATFLFGQYTFTGLDGVTPLDGGKLCAFAATTSTPHDTWVDSALVTKNANPVILNSAGRANSGGIYLDGTNYKFQLLTPGTTTDCTTGSTVWTMDNVEDLANVFFNTTRTANTVYAGPTSGSPAIPTFRALTAADVPSSPWTVISTTATGTQNDFAPGLSNNTVIRCNNATLLTINGFASGTTGQHIMLVSVGAGQVDFAPQAAGSSAANRLINFAAVGNTSLAAGVGAAEYVYDGTTSRWRLVSHNQGAFIDFSATSTIVGWTTFTRKFLQYKLDGRNLTVVWFISGTSNSVTTSFTTPYTATSQGFNALTSVSQAVDNGGGRVTSDTEPTDNSAVIAAFATIGGSAWTNSGTKFSGGQITVVVQ